MKLKFLKALLPPIAVFAIAAASATTQPASSAAAMQQPTSTSTVMLPTATLPAIDTPTLALPTATLPLPTSTTVPATATVPAVDTPTAAVATATVASTLPPTATPGGAAADLTIGVLETPDFVPAEGVIPYVVTVNNTGTGASAATSVLIHLSSGTSIAALGPGCAPAPEGVSCAVPALSPATAASFQFAVSVGGAGTVVTTAVVDPTNAVVEANKANNSATTATTVVAGGPPPGFPPPDFSTFPAPEVQQPPFAAVPPPVAVMVPPIDVAGIQVAPPQAQTGETWLQVLAPTDAYSLDMVPIWTAQPGEWYFVVRVEDGWALAIWEGDTTGWSVWISMDQRVTAMNVDRTDPKLASDLWLVAFQATEAYSASTMELAWTVSPGEWYRVLQTDGAWALVVYESDPLSAAVWIPIDARVQFGPPDAPHSPA